MSKYNGIKLQFTYPHSLAPKNPQKHCVEPIEVDKNSLSKTRSELVENAVILYQEYFQQTAVASLEVLCIDPLPLPTPFPTFRQYSYVCLTLRECLICHKYVHKQYIYLVRCRKQRYLSFVTNSILLQVCNPMLQILDI